MSGETLPALGGKADKIRFNDKAPRGVQLLLYTEGHVTTKGIWQDGSGILGWAPLPEVDKAERDACYAHPHSGFRKPRSYKHEQPTQDDSGGIEPDCLDGA